MPIIIHILSKTFNTVYQFDMKSDQTAFRERTTSILILSYTKYNDTASKNGNVNVMFNCLNQSIVEYHHS